MIQSNNTWREENRKLYEINGEVEGEIRMEIKGEMISDSMDG